MTSACALSTVLALNDELDVNELFLSRCSFKNVQFEIAATDNVGVFDVNAKFMGVPMEKVELVFQV